MIFPTALSVYGRNFHKISTVRLNQSNVSARALESETKKSQRVKGEAGFFTQILFYFKHSEVIDHDIRQLSSQLLCFESSQGQPHRPGCLLS